MLLNPDDIAGRVILTWPAPTTSPPDLMSWDVRITDANSGRDILDAVKVSLVMGSDDGFELAPIVVDLTRMLGPDGEPSGNGITPAVGPTVDGRHPTAVFRYVVAEMAIAPGQP